MRLVSALSVALTMLVVGVAFPALAATAESVPRCALSFSLSDTPPLDSLQFTVDYSQVQGSFVRNIADVDCQLLVSDSSSIVVDSCDGPYDVCQWGEGRFLRVALLNSRDGFAGPAEVLRCGFDSAENIDPDSFKIHIEAASATKSGTDLDPPPDVTIAAKGCGAR